MQAAGTPQAPLKLKARQVTAHSVGYAVCMATERARRCRRPDPALAVHDYPGWLPGHGYALWAATLSTASTC